MRIKGFPNLVKHHLESYTLNDSTVVIDGHNLFYSMYKASRLSYVLGPESDRFASYIRDYFETFKRANVNCLFVIKGGHENEDMLNMHKDRKFLLKKFVLGADYGEFVINPMLAKEIFLQTLHEMGFEYTVCCKNDIVDECSALALELSCPVISFNIQYCFTGAKYIPLPVTEKIQCDKDNKLKCGMFKRENLLKYYNITLEKLILFILIVDSHLFDEKTFMRFMATVKGPYVSHDYLLRWLSSKNVGEALKEIFEHISKADRVKFLEIKSILEKKLSMKRDATSMALLYHIDKNQVEIGHEDPLWFEKGVCLNHIDIPYINLYFYRMVPKSHFIENDEADKSVLLSLDIIKYAYDLLTDFKGGEILLSEEENCIEKYEKSLKKPEYAASSCVFENGWNNISSLFLFEYFLTETFQSFNFDALSRLPPDSSMLVIALVFFTRKKIQDVTAEVYSIMLSYVMLSIVGQKVDIYKAGSAPRIAKQPTLDPTTDKNTVSEEDCEIAASMLKEYFVVGVNECDVTFDPAVVHPLVEFQRCLKELNSLNKLCGSAFVPTVYSETYNGTFVYKILCHIQGSDVQEAVRDMLNSAPTVLAFFEGMIEEYNRALYEY